MYLLQMLNLRRIFLFVALGLGVMGLAACGSDSSSSDVATASLAGAETASSTDAEEADDHGDDHGDDDHDDDHGDDDHDDDHGDDDHDDDHGDDDHDDHDDHDDDKHDDHGDQDEHGEHDDDDHDDHDHDDEGASGGLDAHVHGEGELSVAWSGGDVVVDLVSPAINVFGFEREPADDDERALVEEQTALLTDPDLLSFNAEASCELVGGVETDFVVEGSHAEVTTAWMFDCANPDDINELDLSRLFAAFPGFDDIDAQWASDSGQSAAELSAESTVLRFE